MNAQVVNAQVVNAQVVNDQVVNAQSVLELSRWAAHAYGRYDLARVRRIVEAVARAAEAQAEPYAQRVVSETGLGVVADTTITHLLCSGGLAAKYADQDYVSPRYTGEARLELPRPVGVLMVRTGAREPVADVYRAVLLGLLTRNTVILKPDPPALACVAAAAQLLAAAAVEAGAPDGVIQFIESESESSPVLADLILDARGDEGAVPAVPVFVDATADLEMAAEKLLASVTFNNSLLEGSESVLFVEDSVADSLLAALHAGAAVTLTAPQCDRIRSLPEPIGRDAMAICERANLCVAPGTRVLLAGIGLHERALVDEPLIRQQRYPMLAVVRVPDARTGIRLSAAVAAFTGDRSGPQGSAVIHSRDPETILDFATAVRVRRIVVNDGGNPGGAGVAGSGFGARCEPEQLITWTRVAVDGAQKLSRFEADTEPARSNRVPEYPLASNLKPSR